MAEPRRANRPLPRKRPALNYHPVPGFMPGAHAFVAEIKTWVAGTSPVTGNRVALGPRAKSVQAETLPLPVMAGLGPAIYE